MKTVTAKFVCNSIDEDQFGTKILKMSACTTTDGDGQDFTPYTPWGELTMGITGDVPAAEFFEQGGIYHLEFLKVN